MLSENLDDLTKFLKKAPLNNLKNPKSDEQRSNI